MPHHTPLISTIVVCLVLAFILGALIHRLRASPLIGYLLAGVLIGPFTRLHRRPGQAMLADIGATTS